MHIQVPRPRVGPDCLSRVQVLQMLLVHGPHFE